MISFRFSFAKNPSMAIKPDWKSKVVKVGNWNEV